MTEATATRVRNLIATANEKFMATFKARDAAGMASLYTKDGQLMPPNSDFLTSHEAIQGFWQAVMDMGVEEAKMEIVEVEDLGDRAIEVSTFALYGPGGQVLDEGKYIVIWKQEDGQWKMYRDIFNSSRPVTG
jgi:uncharacterized protein (TIGR02246 family)